MIEYVKVHLEKNGKHHLTYNIENLFVAVDSDHLIYLASPYSHQDKDVEHNRFMIAEEVAASLLKAGFCVYSPIVHCYEMAKKYDLPGNFEFWVKVDEAMLKRCTHMLILDIEGWKESRGVNNEVEIAHRYGIPISRWSQIAE